MDCNDYDEVLKRFPKKRFELPEAYKAIYNEHYCNNRNGITKMSFAASRLESWMHRKVAKSAAKNYNTLEIGAGTLNQLKYEKVGIYDVVEPFCLLYQDSAEKKCVRNFYNDVAEIPSGTQYDRITAIACFEHVCDLPELVKTVTGLLSEKGKLYVAIPNEGRLIWKAAYRLTTGREFKRRYGLDYSVIMNYEHVNTADEIEVILKNNFSKVTLSVFGMGKNFSFYRYYECYN